MNLTEMRTRLRVDLQDEDPDNYRWTDDRLDRRLGQALLELSAAQPLPQTAELTTQSDNPRTVSLTTLTGLVRVEAVEHPVDLYPPAYVDFTVRGDVVTLAVDEAPAAGSAVRVYYGKLHTLDALDSTVPEQLEELLAAGAAGYAAMDQSIHTANAVNLGGPDTWRRYLVLGQEKLVYFRQGLANLSRRTSVRVRRLYRPLYHNTAPRPSEGP